MPGTFNAVLYRCEHCGRTWTAETKAHGSDTTGWTGFLASSTNQHKVGCARRTPAQRVARAKADAKRWKRVSPRHTTIIDDFNHPGMRV